MEDRLPSLRDVQAFVLAAGTGSLRVVAQRLNITISAVSHRIRSLETEIGTSLFVREGRGLKLTPAGLNYQQLVLPLLHSFTMATASAQREADDNLLRVAAFQTFHAQWLSHRLVRFSSVWPQAKIELISLRSKQSRPDITIKIMGSGEAIAHDQYLAEFNVGPVCHPSLLENLADISPRWVLELPLVIANVSVDMWSEWAAGVGLQWTQPKNAIMVDSLPLSVDLAAAGRGVALSSTLFDRHTNAIGLCRPVPHLVHRGALHVNRKLGRERPIVEHFREWLVNEFRDES